MSPNGATALSGARKAAILISLLGDEPAAAILRNLPDEDLRWRSLKAGVICYLPKPIDEKRLLICIHSALNERDAGRR